MNRALSDLILTFLSLDPVLFTGGFVVQLYHALINVVQRRRNIPIIFNSKRGEAVIRYFTFQRMNCNAGICFVLPKVV